MEVPNKIAIFAPKICGMPQKIGVNNGPERVYIQSALRMPNSEKESQEQRPLLNVTDSFRKMIIVGDDIMRKTNDNGVVTMSLFDFLLDENSVSSLL